MPDAGPQAALSADGTRLHLQHGPIDLIIEADGEPGARAAAFEAATHRFDGLLDELVAELVVLKTPLTANSTPSRHGPVATRMLRAVTPFREHTITPMAAVAGAVADEIGATMAATAPLRRWLVNNGGDIAIGLQPGERYVAAVVADPRRGDVAGTLAVDADSGVGGIATSGRHGRSFSLGIADAVTVMAATAAAADAAATIIANHVDIGLHPAIERAPAVDLDPESDLGSRLVVVDVGQLASDELNRALGNGLALAKTYVAAGLAIGASLHLRGAVASTAVGGFNAEPLTSTGAR